MANFDDVRYPWGAIEIGVFPERCFFFPKIFQLSLSLGLVLDSGTPSFNTPFFSLDSKILQYDFFTVTFYGTIFNLNGRVSAKVHKKL